jgi:hypothetical protein
MSKQEKQPTVPASELIEGLGCDLPTSLRKICGHDSFTVIGCTTCEAADRIEALEYAITKTLNENGHLADGENCTLIDLKRAMPTWELE